MIDYKIFININIKNKLLNIFLIIVNLQSMDLSTDTNFCQLI